VSDGHEEKRLVITKGFAEELEFGEDEMPEQGYNYRTHISTLKLKLWPKLLAEGVPLFITVSEQTRWVTPGPVERWQHDDGSWDEERNDEMSDWKPDGSSQKYFFIVLDFAAMTASYSTEKRARRSR